VLTARQVLYGAALASWLLTLLLAGLMLFQGAPWPLYEWMLIALALLALWRPAVGVVALAYLVLHAARMYLFEVRPLLDVVSWPDAVGGALYVVGSWARHEIQRGSFALALAHLFREWLMPVIQLGVLAGAVLQKRLRSSREDA
jgi:hypothetical protein